MPILFAILALLVVQPTGHADVAGEWELLLTDPRGQTHDIELTLEQDGEELTDRAVDQTSETVTGRICGDRITFAYEVDAPGRDLMRLTVRQE